MYRMQVYDGLTTGMHWQVHKVGARHGKLYYERNERMPVAVTIGGDPAYTFRRDRAAARWARRDSLRRVRAQEIGRAGQVPNE